MRKSIISVIFNIYEVNYRVAGKLYIRTIVHMQIISFRLRPHTVVCKVGLVAHFYDTHIHAHAHMHTMCISSGSTDKRWRWQVSFVFHFIRCSKEHKEPPSSCLSHSHRSNPRKTSHFYTVYLWNIFDLKSKINQKDFN